MPPVANTYTKETFDEKKWVNVTSTTFSVVKPALIGGAALVINLDDVRYVAYQER